MMSGPYYCRNIATLCLWMGCSPVPETGTAPPHDEAKAAETIQTETTAPAIESPQNNPPPGPRMTGPGSVAEGSLASPANETSTHHLMSRHTANQSERTHSLQVEALPGPWGGADQVAAADLNADGTDELIRFHNETIAWDTQTWSLSGAIQALIRVPSSANNDEFVLIGTGMGRGHPSATTQVWRLDQSGLTRLYEADTARNQITDLQWVNGRILLTHFMADKMVSSRFLDEPNQVVHQGPMAMQQKMSGQRLVVGRIYGDAPKSHGDLTVYGPDGDPTKLTSLRGVRQTHIADINFDGHPDLLSSDGWHYRYGEQGDARLVVYPGPEWDKPRVLAWLDNDYTIREIAELTINGIHGLLLTGSSGLYWAAPSELGWSVQHIAALGEIDNAAALRTPQGITIAISGEEVRRYRVTLPSATPSDQQESISEHAPRHALLLVIDTLRADSIQQAKTPRLDQVEALGVRVPVAWASGTWTVPSVISILTGASVPEHGWNEPSGRMGKYPPLPALKRLPEVLQGAGFQTSGFYANPYLNEKLGFSKGFDSWKHVSDRTVAKQFAKHVQDDWSDGARHFSYVHILGPHSPVDPSQNAQKRWDLDPDYLDSKGQIGIGRAKRNQEKGIRDAYRKAYLGTVEDTDLLVGQILDALGHHRDHTMVVITSDHGELLGEHNIVGHGTWTWRELVEVPLYFDAPGNGETLPDTMAIHAIPDAVTRMLGVSAQWPQTASNGQPLISQREEHLAWSIDGKLKTIITPKGTSVYDLQRDPHEENPLPLDSNAMAQLATWQAQHPALTTTDDATIQLPDDTLKALEVLGYVE